MDQEQDDSQWQQQQQLEAERWQLTLEALDAACEGKATEEQMKFLARECGVINYKPNGVQHGKDR